MKVYMIQVNVRCSFGLLRFTWWVALYGARHLGCDLMMEMLMMPTGLITMLEAARLDGMQHQCLPGLPSAYLLHPCGDI